MGVNYFKRNGRDTKFLLLEHMNTAQLLGYERFQDFSTDDLGMIVDEALKVGKEVLGPAMQDGDRIGCVYQDGEVTTPIPGRTAGACSTKTAGPARLPIPSSAARACRIWSACW
jgi:hypothetical protein